MTLDIDELLDEHASDKHRFNGYGALYHALFKGRAYDRLNLLEIGIGTMMPNVPVSMYGHDLPGYKPGASLRAWSAFFTQANIYGIDIQPDTMAASDRDKRIFTQLVDSTDADAVTRYMAHMPNLDIVIDDASHLCAHQLASLRNFWPYMRPNGYYIIEDVNRVDPNQPRLPIDYADELKRIVGDDLYFVASFPKADVVVISFRGGL